jgi:hypothetical protein
MTKLQTDQIRYILQDKTSSLFSIKVTKDKEILRNYPGVEKTKEISQFSSVWNPGLESALEKGHSWDG